MIVDSSAIVAILGSEADADSLEAALVGAPIRRVSSVNYVEAAVVIDSRRDPILSRGLDEFLRQTQTAIETVTPEQARIAREAYRDFGKGRHRAGLNLGDCFAYALAKVAGEPLLCKGDDFKKTDLDVAEVQ
ncbi:MAG: putative toxin of the toxin-antitoxin system [Acidobacteriaceae bacterium]|nr:putative toxin of the toxin-antitoxin system [Acidobacteriaceae bacterium]